MARPSMDPDGGVERDLARRRRKAEEWRSWYAVAADGGLEAELVTELVLMDALGIFYAPPERLAECSP